MRRRRYLGRGSRWAAALLGFFASVSPLSGCLRQASNGKTTTHESVCGDGINP